MTDERLTDAVSGPDPVSGADPVVAAARFNTKAVIGLILAVVSVFFVLVPLIDWIVAVPAVILGVLGRKEIVAGGERGRELATAAIVVGALSAALSLVLLIAIGATAIGVAHQIAPGGSSDACTSTTGDFTQQQLQDCLDSQDGP